MIKDGSNNVSNFMFGSLLVLKIYLGSNVMWQHSNIITYTDLEYISSDTNGQYINLGVLLYTTSSPNYDFEIKFNLKGSGQDNNIQATVFNSLLSSTSPYPGVFIRKNNNNVQARRGNNTTVNIGTINLIITYNYDESLGYNNLNRTHSINASLFCVLDGNNNPSRFALCNLYYFKLWLNGVLTMDLVPKKNNNNIIGLYNNVNGMFYTSPNNVAFIAGPEINN